MADTGLFSHFSHPTENQVAVKGLAAHGDEQTGAVVIVDVLPGLYELDQARVGGNVAVIAQLAHRDLDPPRPRARPEGVHAQGAQLVYTHARADQDLQA